MYRSRLKISIAAFLLVIILVFVGVRIIDQKQQQEIDDRGRTAKDAENKMYTVEIDGVKYKRKTNIDNYLLIGLDTFGQMTSSDSYYNNDQADFLLLIVVDHDEKKFSFVQINRDTMTEVPLLGVTGQKYGTRLEQIALSHTYGDGLKISCLNTVDAVENLLYGIKIDCFISMTMDGVIALNDYIGGVPITFKEDYSEISKEYTKGNTVTLDGASALLFTRARLDLSDATNLYRMQRQKEYLKAFFEQVKRSSVTNSFVDGAYDSVDDYILTNATTTMMTELVDDINELAYGDVVSFEGTADYSNEFAEFYANDESIKEIVKKFFLEKQ